MFGLSTWEILIILVLALLFIGPDELPKVANKLGKGLRQVRGAMSKVDDEVRKTMRDFQAEAARLAEDEENAQAKAKGLAPDAKSDTKSEANSDANAGAPAGPTKEAIGGEGGGEPILRELAPPRDLGSVAATTSINARDWSQVGKTPVQGRVATVQPGRVATTEPTPARPPEPPSVPPPPGTQPPEHS
jgi:Sec-independent protein translocase protein TatA